MENNFEDLKNVCNSCTKCSLHKTRNNVVFGRGSESATVMFVGEGPGEQEDIEGKPFVGRAGKLLDLVLEALEFSKEDYYIANVIKCRPPGNREPEIDEVKACLPFLREQVKVIRPKIIVCLGKVAMQNIYSSDAQISKVRGEVIQSKGFIIIPTYHPAYVLRNNNAKKDFWIDMLTVRKYLSHVKENENEE